MPALPYTTLRPSVSSPALFLSPNCRQQGYSAEEDTWIKPGCSCNKPFLFSLRPARSSRGRTPHSDLMSRQSQLCNSTAQATSFCPQHTRGMRFGLEANNTAFSILHSLSCLPDPNHSGKLAQRGLSPAVLSIPEPKGFITTCCHTDI